jgi:IS30 family transposase
MPHLNEEDRARIAAYLESGSKISDLATEFGVGKSTVSRIKKKNGNMREVLNEMRVLIDQKRQTNTKIHNLSTSCDKIPLILLQTQLMRFVFLRLDQQRFVVLLDQN